MHHTEYAMEGYRGQGLAALAASCLFSCGGRSGLLPVTDINAANGHDAGHEAAFDVAPGDAASPSSCGASDAALACGLAGESCCASLTVPAGTYFRSYDPINANGYPAVGPNGAATSEADPATVSSFQLDRFLVTVGRFRSFVAAWSQGYVPPEGGGKHWHLNDGLGLASAGFPGTYESGWRAADTELVMPTDTNLACDPTASTWTPTPQANEGRPMNCVTWWEAYAFCIWDGGFLPSEAEWGYAAAGGSDQREYPWGNTDPGEASAYAVCDAGNGYCYYPTYGLCTGFENLAPVGSAVLGMARWGQMDLVGEVDQWTLDWDGPYMAPCVDCANVAGGHSRVFRGGTSCARLVSSDRHWGDPGVRDRGIGFRCARGTP